MPQQRPPFRKFVTASAIALGLVVCILVPFASWGLDEPSHGVASDGFVKVTRGPIRHVLTETGTVESANKNVLVSTLDFPTQVLEIVPNGTMVEPGDVVAVLDSKGVSEKLQELQFKFIDARAAFEQAKEGLRLQRLTNESEIADAKLAMELTALDLESYEEAEFPQQQHQLQSALVLAEESLARAEKSRDFVLTMFKRGYRSNDDLESENAKLLSARNSYQEAKDALSVFENHAHKRKLTELTALKVDAELHLDRVKSVARAGELSHIVNVSATEHTYETYKFWTERLAGMIEMCTLYAEKAGEVIHVRENPWSSEMVEEGVYVQTLQPVAKIPDRDQLQVEIVVHETKIRFIYENDPVSVRIDATNLGELTGRVSHVARVPSRGNYPYEHLRVYKITIALDISAEIARTIAPGLSAEIKLVANDELNVLRVPVESVLQIAEKHLAFLKRGNIIEECEVEIGITDGKIVEILSGLNEGDEVVSKPRVACANQIVKIQNRMLGLTNADDIVGG